MKVLVVFALCALFVNINGATLDVYDGPVHIEGEQPGIDDKNIHGSFVGIDEDLNVGGERLRARRFTCDVLSFQSKIVSPNHSVCAAHCLSKQHLGGSCKNGICVCRGHWGK